MVKLSAGASFIYLDGKVILPGGDVPDSLAPAYRRAGVVFEGDVDSNVTLVSTPENPIPVDWAGNSVLPEHQALIAARMETLKETDAEAARVEAEAIVAAEKPTTVAVAPAAIPVPTPVKVAAPSAPD